MTGLAIRMPHLEKLRSCVIVINYWQGFVSPEAAHPLLIAYTYVFLLNVFIYIYSMYKYSLSIVLLVSH